MLHGDIQYLFFTSRDSDVARVFGCEPTAINDFAFCGHNSPPMVMLAHSLASFSDKVNPAVLTSPKPIDGLKLMPGVPHPPQ
jgi:hypothetical protein